MSKTYAFTCEHCGRKGKPSDARIGMSRGSRDEPAYEFDACKDCAPSDEDMDRARDHYFERLEAEAREL